jgi:hypothetical protein
MCVCVNIYIYIYTCVYIYVCMYVCIYIQPVFFLQAFSYKAPEIDCLCYHSVCLSAEGPRGATGRAGPPGNPGADGPRKVTQSVQ